MSVFQIQKFPVVSAEGNEYLVVIEDNNYVEGVNVGLYEKRRGWFGREKFARINGRYQLYSELSFDFDYKKMAMSEVIKYENGINKRKDAERKRKQGIEKFERWDGRWRNDKCQTRT